MLLIEKTHHKRAPNTTAWQFHSRTLGKMGWPTNPAINSRQKNKTKQKNRQNKKTQKSPPTKTNKKQPTTKLTLQTYTSTFTHLSSYSETSFEAIPDILKSGCCLHKVLKQKRTLLIINNFTNGIMKVKWDELRYLFDSRHMTFYYWCSK